MPGPTMLAVAIAKVDAVARVLAVALPPAPAEPDVTLSYQQWHDAVNALNDARFALRTQQILTRRASTEVG